MIEHVPTPPLTRWLRRLPILVIAVAAVVGLIYFRHFISFDALAQNRARLIDLRDAHYGLTVLGFVGLYVVVVATSLPGATILTLTGGFLFSVFPGFVYNVIGATVGAVLVFLAARAGFGRDTAARLEARGGTIGNLQTALKANQWSVLLTMRLIPGIPFFVANLLPAFVGIRLIPFAVTTAIGILPANLIFTALGSGLGEVFARGEVPNLGILLQPAFGLPLIGLALLSALPLMVKYVRGKRG